MPLRSRRPEGCPLGFPATPRLNLRLHEASDVVGPPAGSATMIGRAVQADDRHASCPGRAVTRLALGVGHGCFTDRFAWHGFHSEALRHDTRGHLVAHVSWNGKRLLSVGVALAVAEASRFARRASRGNSAPIAFDVHFNLNPAVGRG